MCLSRGLEFSGLALALVLAVRPARPVEAPGQRHAGDVSRDERPGPLAVRSSQPGRIWYVGVGLAVVLAAKAVGYAPFLGRSYRRTLVLVRSDIVLGTGAYGLRKLAE